MRVAVKANINLTEAWKTLLIYQLLLQLDIQNQMQLLNFIEKLLVKYKGYILVTIINFKTLNVHK